MANEEQLRRLTEEGVKAWNEWRRENPDVPINLWIANLRGANLRGANLRGANLRGADLQKADLQEANLRGANLQGAYLDEANLMEANLMEADLFRANLFRANLLGVNLREARLEEAILQGANLQEANLENTNFEDAYFQDADLTGVDCTGLSLSTQQLKQITFSGARFSPEQIKMLLEAMPAGKDFTGFTGFTQTIEFPAGYRQIGVSILSHFSEVLKSKHPDLDVPVRISQDGDKVTLEIDTDEGTQVLVEKTLQEYGMVLIGEKKPEDLLDDRYQIMELKSDIRHMTARFEDRLEMEKEKARLQKEYSDQHIERLKAENEKKDLQLREKDSQLAQYHAVTQRIARDATSFIGLRLLSDGKTMQLYAEQGRDLAERLFGMIENQNSLVAAVQKLEEETDPEPFRIMITGLEREVRELAEQQPERANRLKDLAANALSGAAASTLSPAATHAIQAIATALGVASV